MKLLKDCKCVCIIHNVDIKMGKNSQFFGKITIRASPPICATRLVTQKSSFVRMVVSVRGYCIRIRTRQGIYG